MIHHCDIRPEDLRKKINQKEICFGGNKNLQIVGTLTCKSGKRMKKENRVFFTSMEEAIEIGYRPCRHCMYNAYKEWKNSF